MAVAAFRVRMARFLLDLLARHYELGIAQLRHAGGVSVTGNAFIAGLITGVIMKKDEKQDKLGCQDDHPAARAKEIPEFADSHSDEKDRENYLLRRRQERKGNMNL
jgi:hypothetical protein